MARVFKGGRKGVKVSKNSGAKTPGVGRPKGTGPQSRLSASKSASIARTADPFYNVRTEGGTSKTPGQNAGLPIQGGKSVGAKSRKFKQPPSGKNFGPAVRKGRGRMK